MNNDDMTLDLMQVLGNVRLQGTVQQSQLIDAMRELVEREDHLKAVKKSTDQLVSASSEAMQMILNSPDEATVRKAWDLVAPHIVSGDALREMCDRYDLPEPPPRDDEPVPGEAVH